MAVGGGAQTGSHHAVNSGCADQQEGRGQLTVLPCRPTLSPGRTKDTIKMKYSESERDLAKAHALFEAKPEVATPSADPPARPRRRIVRAPAARQEAEAAVPETASLEPVLTTSVVLRSLGARRSRGDQEPQQDQQQHGQLQRRAQLQLVPVVPAQREQRPLRGYMVRILVAEVEDGSAAGAVELVALRGGDPAEALVGAVEKIRAYMESRYPDQSWRMEGICEMENVLM